MKLRSLLPVALILISVNASAQFLARHIPSTAPYIITLDLKGLSDAQIQEKIQPMDELFESSSSTKGSQILAQIASNPSEYGINADDQAFMYVHFGDTFQNAVILLAIQNKELFKQQALQIVHTNNPDARFKQESGYEVLSVRNEGFAVNDDMAIIVFGKTQHYYGGYGYSSEYYTEREQINNEIQQNPDKELTAEEQRLYELYEERGANGEVIEMEVEEIYFDDDDIMIEDAIAVPEEAPAEEELITEDMEIEEAYEEDVYWEEEVDATEEAVEEIDYEMHPRLKALQMKYDLQKEEQKKEFYVKVAEETDRYLNSYFTLSQDKSMAMDNRFVSAMSEGHDISAWISGNLPSPLYKEMYGYRYQRMIDNGMEVPENKLAAFLEKNYTVIHLDNTQEELKISSVQYMNDELAELYPMKMSGFNDDMYNYVASDPLFAYSFNLDAKKTYDLYLYVFKLVMESMPEERNARSAAGAIELMDLFINKDVLFNTLDGSVLMTFSRFDEYYTTRTRYEYDEETFESNYVEYIDTNVGPIFCAMMGVKKEEYLIQLMSAYEKMGLLVLDGDRIWSVSPEMNRSGDAPKFAIRNGIFFITNDVHLSPEILAEGLPKTERVAGKQLEMLEKSQNGFYFSSNGDNNPWHHMRNDLFDGADKVLNTSESAIFSVVEVSGNTVRSEGTIEWAEMNTEGIAGILEMFMSVMD